MLDAADRPAGGALVKQVLRGYPYAAVLAFSLLFMAVIAPLRKVRSIAKRWADAHIGVVIKPGGYERVAADLEHALDQPAWASAGAVLRASLRPRQSCSARLGDPESSALSRTTSLPSNSCRIVLRRTPLSSPRRRSTRAALTCPPDHPTKLIRSAVRLSILSMTLGPDFPAPNDLERRSSRWGTMSA